MRFLSLLLLSLSTLHASPENHILYCKEKEIERIGTIDPNLYREAIKQLPICCVDIFLFNPFQNAYLMVLRGNAPQKGEWWFPGGRLFKGESFFECAMRKCQTEVGVEIIPLAQLGTYSTLFPDSAWGCQTHTINTIVLAQTKSPDENPATDPDHEDWKWQPLEMPPEDPYLRRAYDEALLSVSQF